MTPATEIQPMRAPDPILAELWEVKRQLNAAAGYHVDELARMAHEATLEVERQWREEAAQRGEALTPSEST